jgi:hypothetical protein
MDLIRKKKSRRKEKSPLPNSLLSTPVTGGLTTIGLLASVQRTAGPGPAPSHAELRRHAPSGPSDCRATSPPCSTSSAGHKRSQRRHDPVHARPKPPKGSKKTQFIKCLKWNIEYVVQFLRTTCSKRRGNKVINLSSANQYSVYTIVVAP